ncbi:MAG: AraC family transcriptional regulator [Polyangiaceae bacterium]
MALSVLFVHAIIEALERAGVPRERFFQAAGLDPAKLERTDLRLDFKTYESLSELALSLSGDEAFGLHMIERVNPASYNLTAHLAAHATTLRDAIESMQRFYQLLTDRPFWRFAEDAATATLSFEAGPGSPPARRFRSETTLTGFHRMITMFAPQARLRMVAFDYPAPAYHAEYTRIFGGAEQFDQKFTGIVFDRALLSASHVNRDPELHAAIVTQAERRVSRLRNDAGYAERVRRHILEGAAPARHDMQSISRELGVSARSLRRRLDEEGTSFREVVESALGVLAKRLVADKDRPIEDVAYAMGFSHPNAFHRAFKRWTGATPGASRPPPPRGDARSEPPREPRARRTRS